MKIVLPSNGLLGTRIVDLRPPTFNDLRNVQNLNQQDALLKAQFIQSLVKDLDLTKITKFDLEYLFLVAAFSLTFNSITYHVDCPKCGEHLKETLVFGGQEVRELKKDKYPFVQKINGTEFIYHILSAQQEVDAWEYALTQEDEDSAYEDASVAFIFGKTLEDIDWVKVLPASIFISALVYQQFNFHGVLLDEVCTCSKCKEDIKVRVTVPADVVKIDVAQLMAKFVDVSDEVTFSDFCKFTMSEYKAFMDALNLRGE